MEGKAHMAGTEGISAIWPARQWGLQFNKLQRTESCQNHGSLEQTLPQFHFQMCLSSIPPNTFSACTLVRATGREDPANPVWIPDPQKLEDMFLATVVICYTERDNHHIFPTWILEQKKTCIEKPVKSKKP